jgi:hypothetical protein
MLKKANLDHRVKSWLYCNRTKPQWFT